MAVDLSVLSSLFIFLVISFSVCFSLYSYVAREGWGKMRPTLISSYITSLGTSLFLLGISLAYLTIACIILVYFLTCDTTLGTLSLYLTTIVTFLFLVVLMALLPIIKIKIWLEEKFEEKFEEKLGS